MTEAAPKIAMWVDCASCGAGWPLVAAWPREVMPGRSLLAHAMGIARATLAEVGCGAAEAVRVITVSRECAAEARKLGADAVKPADAAGFSGAREAPAVIPPWPVDIPATPGVCHILMHARAPLLDPKDIALLARAAIECHGMAEVAAPVLRHPVAAFMPKQGRMDFAATIDSPRWQELEATRVMHFPLVARAKWDGGERGAANAMAILAGDGESCFRVLSDADLFVASSLLRARGASHGGRRPWRMI